jgi:hypothetical protein
MTLEVLVVDINDSRAWELANLIDTDENRSQWGDSVRYVKRESLDSALNTLKEQDNYKVVISSYNLDDEYDGERFLYFVVGRIGQIVVNENTPLEEIREEDKEAAELIERYFDGSVEDYHLFTQKYEEASLILITNEGEIESVERDVDIRVFPYSELDHAASLVTEKIIDYKTRELAELEGREGEIVSERGTLTMGLDVTSIFDVDGDDTYSGAQERPAQLGPSSSTD